MFYYWNVIFGLKVLSCVLMALIFGTIYEFWMKENVERVGILTPTVERL